MNIFADLTTESPVLRTARHAFWFFVHHAGSEDMVRFYIYVALGLLATLIVQRLAIRVVRRLLRTSDPDIVNRVTAALSMPLGLLTFSYFFLIAFDAIKSMPHELWMHVHSDLYPVLNGLLILICAFRLVDIIAQLLRKRWEGDRTPLDERWADLIGLVGKSIVSFGAGVFIIQKIDPSFNVIPLLTGVSFVGAAVALASQNTIANAIGSMEIMVDRLFKEGDRIAFNDYDGFVVRMGLRSITLVAMTGEKINLPNKDLVDRQIRNFTRGKVNRTTINLAVRYDTSRAELERAIGLMDSVIGAHARVTGCESGLRRYTDLAIELQANFWADYKTVEEYNKLLSELQLALKEAFDQAKIGFSYTPRPVTPS